MMQEISNMNGNGYGQSHIGSSSVGSRLAGGDDLLTSRLSSSRNGTNGSSQAVSNSNQSPIYRPSAPVKSSGFGSQMQVPASSSTSKIGANLNMQAISQGAMDKAESLKTWSVKTYKCTKQIFSEKWGKGTRTVDPELESKIETLRSTKLQYENLKAVSQALSTHISNTVQAQRVLGELFSDMSLKSNELQEEFRYNSDTQNVLVKNGENLVVAINFFIDGLDTLCHRTMEDTVITITKYEQARVEYDAYRTEMENVRLLPRNAINASKLGAAEVKFTKQKAIYDRLREDVGVKIQFLDENRIKVMQKHLLLFHNAITAFYAGNQQMLEATLKQFSVAPRVNGPEKSFLETH